ncbi:unnamed protein product [Linum tenue]|uniref:Uncharacterized protein n=1 Tax=Linum tenue TaxID=586396 RepID=A0AAV0Q2Q7_9ROSI|nr:unnamed protein product [Linum tenue]
MVRQKDYSVMSSGMRPGMWRSRIQRTLLNGKRRRMISQALMTILSAPQSRSQRRRR